MALLVTSASLALAQPSKPQDDVYGSETGNVAEARKHFNEGVRLNAAGKVAEALKEFQTAYDLVPGSWKILYNIGQTSRHVRDYARSLRAFEKYLNEGGDIPRARRAEVEKEIQQLRPLVGSVEISVNAQGADVFVDDAKVGVSPLAAAVSTNSGKRRVRVAKDGKSATKDVDVPGNGGLAKVEIVLETGTGATPPVPTASATPTATATVETPSPGNPNAKTYATVAWIATGVFAAGAAATGTIALVESKDLADSPYAGPDRRPAEDSDLASQASRIDTLAVVTDVLVGAAIVSAGAAVYFTFFAGPSAAPQKGGGNGQTALTVRAGPRGASLMGRF